MVSKRSTARQSAIVLVGSLAVLSGLAYLLRAELNRRSSGRGDRQAVAKLTEGVQEVQRKFDREVLWEEVENAEVLYNHDAIRTAEQSQAKILFDDGTLLELAENSLVVLDRDDGKVAVEFVKGSIFASGGGSGGSGVEIQTEQGRVAVGGDTKGALNLTSGKSGLEVTVTEGSAQLLSASGGVTALGMDEKGKLTADGVQKEKVIFKLELPKPQARFLIDRAAASSADAGKARVRFRWAIPEAVKANLTELKLQLATDPEFVKPAGNKTLTLADVEKEIELKTGAYYWRLVGKTSSGTREISEPREIEVFDEPRVVLESPAQTEKRSYFNDAPVQSFVWKKSDTKLVSQDVLEISQDPNFQTLIPVAGRPNSRKLASLKDSILEARSNPLSSGRYYWRVKSRYLGVGPEGKDEIEKVSEVREITVAKSDRLLPPTLIEPASRAILGLNAAKTTVSFRWESSSDAKSYGLRIAADPEFNRVIFEKWVATSTLETEVPATGSLYWQVISSPDAPEAHTANRPLAKDSDPSQIRVFGLTREGGFRLTAPERNATIEFLEKTPEVTFKWEHRGGAKSYEIQVASDPAFKDVRLKETLAASDDKDPVFVSDEVPSGKLFWRVRALNAKEEVLALSERGEFVMKESARLAAPEVIEPASGFKIPEEPKPEIHFKWKEVLGAKEYLFELYRETSAKKWERVEEEDPSKPELKLKLEGGSYRWTVRAVDRANRKGQPSLERTLLVRSPDRLPAPELGGPIADSLIEKRDPIEIPLKWVAVPEAKEYLLKVETIAANGERSVVIEKKVSDTEFKLPDSISSGKYIWSVTGLKDDKKAKPGIAASSKFEVRWTGLLQAPKRLNVKQEDDQKSLSRIPAALRKVIGSAKGPGNVQMEEDDVPVIPGSKLGPGGRR